LIVVDAGIVLGLALPLSYSERVIARMRALKEAREEIYAPALMEYEVCAALRRAVTQRVLDRATASACLECMHVLGIRSVSPASSLHEAALVWADRLQHSKAYDAQYLALAEQMGCNLLTADQRLVNATRALGITWVEGVDGGPEPRQ
jgi:predicted nucleic acid-binding protein